METFEIGKKDFILNGQPFKIMSGAIHYFRVPREDWYHSLYNLKAMGFNTVETYIPWNLHETNEGVFDFSEGKDIEHFLDVAQSLGLYAIVRPTPYVCGEWEFGGLPAWLLEKDVRLRSRDPKYLSYVEKYYQELLPRLVDHQLDHGGNVLMFQVENEYGSYGEDKDYLRAIRQMMLDANLTMPLFTSDGPWRGTVRAGSLVEDGVLETGNFGSKAAMNFADLESYFAEHDREFPLMSMEFWDGWFNRYNEPIVTRETDELVESVRDCLRLGSINLYMFHGGTSFGFMNGCSARGEEDLPQLSSYDYGAPLNEQGNPTEKYYALQRMIHEEFPDIEQHEPLIKPAMATQPIALSDKVSLFNTVDALAKPIETVYPETMEALGQNYGYLLYRTHFEKDTKGDDEETIRLIDGRDRAQVYLNQEHLATQYQFEIGDKIQTPLTQKDNQLDILIENMGRVNYGSKLAADTQRKGFRQGVMVDLHFILNWQQYCLPLDNIEAIDFSGEWMENQPAFYRYDFSVNDAKDSYIDLRQFGKGSVFVNGINIGRFWNVGPAQSLYVPGAFLNEGENTIVIFETEGVHSETIQLVEAPLFSEVEGKARTK
ncbi:MAG: beta-galactosidase [Aerococcus sp.]|nr:beta-galactosidase [Aerococcus sp.]